MSNIEQPMGVHLQQCTNYFTCPQSINFRSGILSAVIFGQPFWPEPLHNSASPNRGSVTNSWRIIPRGLTTLREF